MKPQSFLAAMAAVTLAPATAFAFEYVTVGVGAQFQAGGNFLDKPGDQTLEINGQREEVDPEYPGFAGLTIGGGGYLDVRAVDYVGIEFGVLYTTDKGSAELKISDTSTGAEAKYDLTIAQRAIHMPLLVKGVIPGEIAQPMLFVGPEFVVPVADAEADVVKKSGNMTLLTETGALSEAYIVVAFGLGVEFKLPIPAVDIRLPLTLRGGINPGVSDEREERANHTIEGNTIKRIEYKTSFKYEANANLGASIHF